MTRERNSNTSTMDDVDMLNLIQQERLTRHLGNLIEQAETQARLEREEERNETRAQHDQLMIAMHEFVNAARTLADENRNLRDRMDQLHSEVRTLRSVILLAHNAGRDSGSALPLGLDVAVAPDPFGSELFSIPTPLSSRSNGNGSSNGAGKTKKKRNMSPEARARISAAQKARWAARRGE